MRSTHAGPIELDKVRSAKDGFYDIGGDSFQVVADRGHGCTLTYLAPGMPEGNYLTHPPALMPGYAAMLSADQLSMLHHLRVAVGTVFPNFSFIETQVAPGEKALIIRLWQPVSALEMEVLSWVLAEAEAEDGYKDRALRHGFHNFGAAGVFEQDDLEIWASATQASDNPIARRYPYSFPHQPALPGHAGARSQMARPRLPAAQYGGCPVQLHALLGRGDAVEPLMTPLPAGAPVDDAACVEVQRFLYREAAALDRRAYEDWLKLLTGDVRYLVLARVARRLEAGALEVAIIDESLESLTLRVRQLADPRLSHAENPPSLARRFLSNVQVETAVAPDAYTVDSKHSRVAQSRDDPRGRLLCGRAPRRPAPHRLGPGGRPPRGPPRPHRPARRRAKRHPVTGPAAELGPDSVIEDLRNACALKFSSWNDGSSLELSYFSPYVLVYIHQSPY